MDHSTPDIPGSGRGSGMPADAEARRADSQVARLTAALASARESNERLADTLRGARDH